MKKTRVTRTTGRQSLRLSTAVASPTPPSQSHPNCALPSCSLFLHLHCCSQRLPRPRIFTRLLLNHHGAHAPRSHVPRMQATKTRPRPRVGHRRRMAGMRRARVQHPMGTATLRTGKVRRMRRMRKLMRERAREGRTRMPKRMRSQNRLRKR